MNEEIEYRVCDRRFNPYPYCGQSPGEAWVAIELAWGSTRRALMTQGYMCLPFKLVPLFGVNPEKKSDEPL